MANIFNVNPSLTNGLGSTYVAPYPFGNNTTGDGSITAPYATIYKATTTATSGTNIILSAGMWSTNRNSNDKSFNFFGCGIDATVIYGNTFVYTHSDKFYYLTLKNVTNAYQLNFYLCENVKIENCYFLYGETYRMNYSLVVNTNLSATGYFIATNTIFANCYGNPYGFGLINEQAKNNIIVGSNPFLSGVYASYCNFTTNAIPTLLGGTNNINNSITGQTASDYFSLWTGDSATSLFTAKSGSKNIGAGYQKKDIGFSLGFTIDTSDDEFLEANGAILKNTYLDAVTGCLFVDQRDKGIINVTETSFDLASDASSLDDYYNGLTFTVMSGTGVTQQAVITDYTGNSRTVYFSTLETALNNTSRISIDGYCITARYDFGSTIKIMNNQFLANFGYNETTPAEYTEFIGQGKTIGERCSFSAKMSDFDNLPGMSFKNYMFGREMYSDGTNGDADDNYVISSGVPSHVRYAQFKFDFKFYMY
jgi:hypothetical protein